jgi:hypothetical protein
MPKRIIGPDGPERGFCDPGPEKEIIELPDENPVKVPTGIPIEVPEVAPAPLIGGW